jgi:hypothetical protein
MKMQAITIAVQPLNYLIKTTTLVVFTIYVLKPLNRDASTQMGLVYLMMILELTIA